MARLRLGLLTALVALLAVVGFSGLAGLGTASAAAPAGNFEEYATNASPVVAVGNTFHVLVGVNTDAAAPNFGAVQWQLNYDLSFISTSTASITPATGQNVNCTSKGDSPNIGTPASSFVLLGCLSLAGDTMHFSGDQWDVAFTCNAAGTSPLPLINTTGGTAKTFVKIAAANFPGVLFTNAASVTCIDTADISTTKTGPATVNAGGSVSYTVVATNNGPSGWTGALAADDLPDDMVATACTFDVDVNGDGTADSTGNACVFQPSIANPFGPTPPTFNNVELAPVDAPLFGSPGPVGGIAVNGSVTMHVTATAPATCGEVLVDTALGVSTDMFGGTKIADPDFLDGVDMTENNFAGAGTVIGNCPVTIVKSGPTAGAQGGTSSYTLTVHNAGPSDASGVVVTDVLDAHTTLNGTATTTVGTCDTAITCTIGTIPAGTDVTITIPITFATPGAVCNTANGTWDATTGTTASNAVCYTIIPPFNGLVKSVDGQVPGSGESSINVNLWLCTDQATDGIDNDGNSSVDDEAPTCQNPGEGSLDVHELLFTSADCDTRNDDDDGDGKPVDGSVADGSTTSYVGSNPRSECYQPTLQDYQLGLVDKDGGEVPEGLGAFEFQIKFDNELFNVDISQTGANWLPAGRTANCTMTIITENDIRYGCVSTGSVDGFGQVSGVLAADVVLTPNADLFQRIRPTKDNGVTASILDEQCEVADTLGDIFPNTNAGLTKDCTDLGVTIRRLEGDVNGDCQVNLEDQQLDAFRYGSFFGSLNYSQFYDLQPWPTGDFDIDIKDLQFVFGRDGSNCAGPLIPDNQNPLPPDTINTP